jgi:hypothetical protein
MAAGSRISLDRGGAVAIQRQNDRRHEEVERADRRHFLTVTLGVVVSLGLLLSAHWIYRATGPHPRMTLFLRRVKRVVDRLFKARPR